MKILTVSCWTHAIKYSLFCRNSLTLLAWGMVERVDLGGSSICLNIPGKDTYCSGTGNDDHKSAIPLIIATLTRHGTIGGAGEIAAVGHRVAHGGEIFRQSVLIDPDVLTSLRSLAHLAPLHLDPNIAGIETAMAHLPGIPQVAIFDTAFHLSMPEHAYLYPLPYEWYERYGVRRYGFHGPSHLYLSRRAAALLGRPAHECNLVTIHSDKGVSVCAIRDGRSIDTSMGMTPLEGVVMETRCGDIDPGIPAFMMQEMNLSPQELEHILNEKSGIYGLTGKQRKREEFLLEAGKGTPRCETALEMETYRIRKYIGGYIAAIGRIDAIVFTAGAGAAEWAVREAVLDGLEGFGVILHRNNNRQVSSGCEEVEITGKGSAVRIFVIPTNEELVMAEDAGRICAGDERDMAGEVPYSFAEQGFKPFQPKLDSGVPSVKKAGNFD